MKGKSIVLCEAKIKLTPEVIGQALVYTYFAKNAGATVIDTIVFCESGTGLIKRAAEHQGLILEIG